MHFCRLNKPRRRKTTRLFILEPRFIAYTTLFHRTQKPRMFDATSKQQLRVQLHVVLGPQHTRPFPLLLVATVTEVTTNIY